jgi:hypothetical protein
LPRLAWNRDPPDLCFLVARITGLSHWHLAIWETLRTLDAFVTTLEVIYLIDLECGLGVGIFEKLSRRVYCAAKVKNYCLDSIHVV